MGDRFRDWRNRLLRRPGFQDFARRFFLTRPIARRRAQGLFDLLGGFVYSQILLACVRLRVLERLSMGSRDTQEIARDCGLSSEACERLLRAAAALDLVQERSPSRYALGARGAELVGNPWLGPMIEHHARLYADLSDPVLLLRDPARSTSLEALWAYAGAEQPDALIQSQTREYSELMAASQTFIASQVLDAVTLRPYRSLLDVGGGHGGFVTAVSRRAPWLQLQLYDLPAVAAGAADALARNAPGLEVGIHGGDFRDAALPAGADIVSLIRVLHDHDDRAASALLRAVAKALPAAGTILIAEPMAREGACNRATDAYFGFYLLAMRSGRPRRVSEIRRMLRDAGFSRVREHHGPTTLQLAILTAEKC